MTGKYIAEETYRCWYIDFYYFRAESGSSFPPVSSVYAKLNQMQLHVVSIFSALCISKIIRWGKKWWKLCVYPPSEVSL